MAVVRLSVDGTYSMVTPDTSYLHQTDNKAAVIAFTNIGLVLLINDPHSNIENPLASALVRPKDRPIYGDVELFCYDSRIPLPKEPQENKKSVVRIVALDTRAYLDLLHYYSLQMNESLVPIQFCWRALDENKYSVHLPHGVADSYITTQWNLASLQITLGLSRKQLSPTTTIRPSSSVLPVTPRPSPSSPLIQAPLLVSPTSTPR